MAKATVEHFVHRETAEGRMGLREIARRAKSRKPWISIDRKTTVIVRTDWRLQAYEREIHEPSTFHRDEGCVNPQGEVLLVVRGYGTHKVDGELRQGYVAWNPERGTFFHSAGELFTQHGEVRHLRLAAVDGKQVR
ncbi:hypothetical protein [Variovorax sp. Sphag1AA]|uniref:hypothetical protein n=1 Tax=Variovorax sp. Sphag1AA TaxID=2587027 RepID=UPI001607C28F|nr:hypothetical protein [Variovorax sp. Sphag1AA]MBB3179744.1 hypothetical protein [Variovorax sp. Sphag1AA]